MGVAKRRGVNGSRNWFLDYSPEKLRRAVVGFFKALEEADRPTQAYLDGPGPAKP